MRKTLYFSIGEVFMSFFEKIHNFFDYQVTPPSCYGIYHLSALAVIIAFTFFLCKKYSRCDDRVLRRIALICWLVILAFEIYKQLNYSISFNDGAFVWDYQWYIFPFQFCSTPLYVLPLIAFVKNERIHKALIAYMGTFSLFAGLAVCIYPGDVFIGTLGINIQTMVHHGMQVSLGIFFTLRQLLKDNEQKLRSYLLDGAYVFALAVTLAMIMNILMYHLLPRFGINETFNMFYISPYYNCTLPLLSVINTYLPYAPFIILYIGGFAVAAFVVLAIVSLIVRKAEKIHASK